MNLFNIDMHISIAHDIRELFREMGHSVTLLSMSGHAIVNGWTRQSTSVIHPANWMHIDQKMCDLFADRYGPLLDRYDGFIHSYPPAFAALFEKLDNPIYTIACTRYEYPCGSGGDATPERLAWLNDRLMAGNRSGQIKFIANNKFDKKYCETFCGGEWEFIPSICTYVEQYKCNGSSGKIILWDRNEDGLRDEIRHPNVLRWFSTWDGYHREALADLAGIIHIPYNISVMSSFEHYAMGIPMYVPSVDLLKKWKADGRGVLCEVEFCDTLNGPVPDEWLGLADWYDTENMPGVMLFDSWEHLRELIDGTDREAVTEQMRAAWRAKKVRVMEQWSEVLA